MKKIYLFLILISFIGCEKDEILSPTLEPNLTSQIQNQFSLSKYDDEYVKDFLKVNWNQIPEADENNEFHEFTTNLNSTLQKENSSLYYKYTVIANLRNNKKWEFHIVKFTAFDIGELQNVSIKDQGDFTGTIHRYNFLGILDKIEGFKEGKLISTYKKNPALLQNADFKYHPADWDQPSESRWEMVRTEYWRDYWALTYNSYGQVTNMRYTGSYRYNVRTEYIYVPANHPAPGMGDQSGYNTYHQHNNAPHGPSPNQNPHSYEEELEEEPVQIIKDISFVGTKAECVYDKLKTLNGDLFKTTIGSFIDDPEFNLIFKVGQCSNTDDACTNVNNIDTSGEISIIIENINSNPVQLASYILHEGIHAEMARYVHQYQQEVNVNDRPRLFQLYKYYHDLYDNEAGEIDHIYMTEKFIKPIASTLKQLDGNRYPLDYYKAFAWDGLRIWDANDLLNMDPESPNFEDYRVIVNQTSTLCDPNN